MVESRFGVNEIVLKAYYMMFRRVSRYTIRGGCTRLAHHEVGQRKDVQNSIDSILAG